MKYLVLKDYINRDGELVRAGDLVDMLDDNFTKALVKHEFVLELQKYYAERIKSWASNLKEIAQQDDQEKLANYILNIKEAGTRICVLQNEWRADNRKELCKLEQSVEEGYQKNG